MNTSFSRRAAIKSTTFGLLAASIPNIVFAKNIQSLNTENDEKKLFHRYPSIDDEIVQTVVGASHFNFELVQKLVNQRPELARATWDWGFGDWETAVGAASHVGRRDIVNFLISKGARPNIFTYAMLGHYKAVKAMIKSIENVQAIEGPHGISLLQHAKFGLRQKDQMTKKEIKESEKLIRFLEKLGNADEQRKFIEIAAEEKEKYIGDYRFGDAPENGFTVKLNMRKMLSLGKLGKGGGGLLQIAPNEFLYNGTSSVRISFQFEEGKVVSLTVKEPDLVLIAKKVS